MNAYPLTTRITDSRFKSLKCVELVSIPEVVHRVFTGDWMILVADEEEGFAVIHPDGEHTRTVEVPSVTVGNNVVAMSVTHTCSMLAALAAVGEGQLSLHLWKDITEMRFTPTTCTTLLSNFTGEGFLKPRLLWALDDAYLVIERDGTLEGAAVPKAWALPDDSPLTVAPIARPHAHIPLVIGGLAVSSSSWNWIYVDSSMIPVYGSEDFPPSSGITIQEGQTGHKFPVVAFVQENIIHVATGFFEEESDQSSSLLSFPKAHANEIPGELCFLPRTDLHPCLRLASSNANQRSITIRNFEIWDVERTITFPEAVLPRGLRPPIISMSAGVHVTSNVSTIEMRERDRPDSPLPSRVVRGVANVMGEAVVRSRGGLHKLRERARSSGFGFMLSSRGGSSPKQSARLSRDTSTWAPVVMLVLAAGDLSEGVLYFVEIDSSSAGSLVRADRISFGHRCTTAGRHRGSGGGQQLSYARNGILGLTCNIPEGPFTLWRPMDGSRINRLGGPETVAVENENTLSAQPVMMRSRADGRFLLVGDAHAVHWYALEDETFNDRLSEVYVYSHDNDYGIMMDCSGVMSSQEYDILIAPSVTGATRPCRFIHIKHDGSNTKVQDNSESSDLLKALQKVFSDNPNAAVRKVIYLSHSDRWSLVFDTRIALFSPTSTQWVSLGAVDVSHGLRSIVESPHTDELLVIPVRSRSFYAVSSGNATRSRGAFVGHDAAVSTLQVLGDPSRLVSADEDGVLLIWHIPSRVCLCSLDGHYHTSNYRVKPSGLPSVIVDCQVGDDPRDLVTVDIYGVCIRWDMLTCRPRHLTLVGRGSSLTGFTSFGGISRMRSERIIPTASSDLTVVGCCALTSCLLAIVLSDGSLEVHPVHPGGEASLGEIWGELTALSNSAAAFSKGVYSFEGRDAGTPGWVLATLLRTQPRLLLDWLPENGGSILHYWAETNNTAALAMAYALAEELGIELSFRLDGRITSTMLISLSNKCFQALDVQLAYATSLSRHGAGYISSLLTPILMASTYRASDLPSLRDFLDSRLMETGGNRSAPGVLPSSGKHEISSCITTTYYSLFANAYGLPRRDYYRALGIRKPESDEYTTESNIRVLCLPNASWSLKWDLWFSHLPDEILTSRTMRLLFAHQWQTFGWLSFMAALVQWLLYVTLSTKYIIDYSTDRHGREVLAGILLFLSFAYYIKEGLQLQRISWRSYLDDATNLSLLLAVTMMVSLIAIDFATDRDFHEHWNGKLSLSQYASVTMIVILINTVTMFRGFENLAWMFRLVVEVSYSVRWFFVMLAVFVVSMMLAVWVVDYPVDPTQATLGGLVADARPGSVGRVWYYFLSVYRIGLLGDTMESQIDNMRGSDYMWFIVVANTYIINITLLNLLIAIMSSSYDDISSRAAVMVSRERWAMLGETEFASAGVLNWVLSWFGRTVTTEKRYPRYLVANFPSHESDPPTRAEDLAADHPLALARASLAKYHHECESSTTEMEMRMVAALGGGMPTRNMLGAMGLSHGSRIVEM